MQAPVMTAEQKTQKDFTKALVINTIFIAALVTLYFVNRATGFVDNLVHRFISY